MEQHKEQQQHIGHGKVQQDSSLPINVQKIGEPKL